MNMDPTADYDEKWFKIKAREHLEWYQGFARALYEEFSPAAAADVGCGCGTILDSLFERGVKVCGWDGSQNAFCVIPRRIAEFITIHDFQNGFPDVDTGFDLAICMEVAEHLPQGCADGLVRFLTGLSDTVYFTAASPGQGGRFHVNEQPPQYWADKFLKLGFKVNVSRTKRLIELMLRYSNGAFWVIKNSLVFEKC